MTDRSQSGPGLARDLIKKVAEVETLCSSVVSSFAVCSMF